jgi:hypothetical protein
MATPRLLDVLDALITAISAAINDAQIPQDDELAPGQTVAGWAVTTELTKILSLGQMNHLVVLWPLKPMKGAVYSSNDPYCQVPTPPTVGLTAAVTVVGGAYHIQFGGSVAGVYNIHSIVDGADALVTTSNAESLPAVATAVAAAITDLDLSGVSANATGSLVVVTGAFDLACNVGGTGSIAREVDRVTRLIQVTTYAPSPEARTLIDDAIVGRLGTTETDFLTLSDGQALYVRNTYAGEYLNEKAQLSYSAYQAVSLFKVEYPIMVASPATQIGAIALSGSAGAAAISHLIGSS